MLTIATWNVNSVKARKERLLAWLAKHQPDVLCLQELKCQDAQFPFEETKALGYHAAVHGQKTYNGVAILSRTPLSDVSTGMHDDEDDPQARVIAANVGDVRVVSIYVPNGGEPDSDKHTYKLRWLERLRAYLKAHESCHAQLAVCGDLNIAPTALDVSKPEEWNDTVLCLPAVRQAFDDLIASGLVDTFRKHHAEGGLYSWWDYRMLGFPKNNGLRIDHVLASKALASRCTGAAIDREERKGKSPSDHAPVLATFE
jgi:exodeoxyribonuclease III